MNANTPTPMLKQYLKIKGEYPGCLLFYRVGDFYEMFYDDAIVASKALSITLTKKKMGTTTESAPLCGVPYHAADTYLAKLLAQGFKVAVCDQMEDPAFAKGIVRREVTRVLTPGTVTSDAMLDPESNSYIASVALYQGSAELAYTDITTGEMEILQPASYNGERLPPAIENELARIMPREIVVSSPDRSCPKSELEEQIKALSNLTGAFISLIDLQAEAEGDKPADAVHTLIEYIKTNQKSASLFMDDPVVKNHAALMLLDRATIRNLELLETMFDRSTKGSLFSVLNHTRTAMGTRLLKKSICEPLASKKAIDSRLDAVAYLLDDELICNDIREALRSVYDIERLTVKIATGRAGGRDLAALVVSLSVLPDLRLNLLDEASPVLLKGFAESIDPHSGLVEHLSSALEEGQPLSLSDGGLIRAGYSEELDGMRAAIADSKKWIAELESVERERTGIKSLKVRFNRVQGYYIEIRKANLAQVPSDYIRRQTLVQAERFVTEKLKEMEDIVLSAESKINKLEYDIFIGLREEAAARTSSLKTTGTALAQLDLIQALATVARRGGYTRPVISDSYTVEIAGGRHPVLEELLSSSVFVPNDIRLDLASSSMALITGPNMAGKSTYMRQTALIVLMAQMGSFVPAASARIGVCDRIFTRIGASDNLVREESTFFTEMRELSYILSEYTDRSLLLLDEIGRGTSTYDGLAIAWAVLEYLCTKGKKARTLFATHYHELTALEGRLNGLVNLSTSISEDNDSIIYLHKIVTGSSNRSYGIHVARLAKIPDEILATAGDRLKELESENARADRAQLSLFDTVQYESRKEESASADRAMADGRTIRLAAAFEEIESLLGKTDPMNLTGYDALKLIEEMKAVVSNEK
ncbi:MAG: DNA mismatch repair protein MutS [Clostridiales Family XIII bacterium]|jgi:DNA mismatch repair protein MutS|nr:DNA mismatch repair protein MutS [Clostridiales Family XIII bacterium]